MTEQRWLRILSISFVMYTIAYIDRTNVSMALPAMSAELHMDPRQAGDAVGVFFWGYLLLQMPAGYLAQHWSAKRVVGILARSFAESAAFFPPRSLGSNGLHPLGSELSPFVAHLELPS